MATCVLCGKPISDGLEYCSECNAKNKADESYLDSLLSSVSASSAEPLKNRVGQSPKSTANPIMPKFLASKAAKVEAEKFEEAIANEINRAEDTDDSEGKYDILSIADDSYLDNLFEDAEVTVFSGGDEHESVAEAPKAQNSGPDFFSAPGMESSIDEEIARDSAEPISEEDFLADLLGTVDSAVAESGMEQPAEDPLAALDEAFALAEGDAAAEEKSLEDELDAALENLDITALPDEEPQAEASDVSAETKPSEDIIQDPELTFAEIPGLEEADLSIEEEPEEAAELKAAAEEGKSKVTVVENSGETSDGGDEDILEFWNNINGEGGEAEGKYLLNADNTEPAEAEATEAASDENDELAALLAGLPGMDDVLSGTPEGEQLGEIEAPDAPEKKAKKKKGFFARIFGNVREEYTEEEMEERKQKALEQLDKEEEAAAQSKEEKAARAAAAKAAKAEAAKAKKAAAEEAKKKKAEDAKAKKEEKDKKAAARRAIIEEIEANEGRINKIGASLVFVVFAIILCFIAIGTSVYTYRVAIDRAEKDFERDEYEKAYQDIYGIDVREEDRQLYDQIMTVNYVNTQLMSYLKYTGLEMENEALDSLLKGLRRYEKYIVYARELGVDVDLDGLRDQILKELDSKYNLSEERAYAIISSASQELYSQAVRDVVDSMNN